MHNFRKPRTKIMIQKMNVLIQKNYLVLVRQTVICMTSCCLLLNACSLIFWTSCKKASCQNFYQINQSLSLSTAFSTTLQYTAHENSIWTCKRDLAEPDLVFSQPNRMCKLVSSIRIRGVIGFLHFTSEINIFSKTAMIQRSICNSSFEHLLAYCKIWIHWFHEL